MRKRIYLNMVFLTTLAVLFAAALLCLVFYAQFAVQVKADLRERLQVFMNDDTPSALRELEDYAPADLRATLILADGGVRFDSVSDIRNLENHLEREEVAEALASGSGESSRYSSTLGLRTYYYAIRLADGSVLRFAKTTHSLWGLFAEALPIVLGIVLAIMAAGYLWAGRLTKGILAPINQVELEGELTAPYDELAPFVRAIARQREKIAEDFAALQKSNHTIHAITENMNEGVVMVGGQGAILSINKSAIRIFDADPALEGRQIRELSRDLTLMAGIQRALSGSAENMTFAKDGRLYNVLLSPVAKTGAILFLLDITEKALADQRRREFSANVSHELKTPLTSIYGNAEMLAGGVVKDGDQQRFYEKIMDEASRLMTLIEDIIMLSELDEKADPPQFETIDLAQVAAACREALAQKAAAFAVSLTVQGGGTLSGSSAMIHEMLYNLMDNAIKYNKPGGSVLVEISETAAGTKIYVTDTGIGIPAVEQERVFERFYRVDKSRSKKTGGTGLGLAIVKHIVLAHDGMIRIVNTGQTGTKIEITFSPLKAH